MKRKLFASCLRVLTYSNTRQRIARFQWKASRNQPRPRHSQPARHRRDPRQSKSAAPPAVNNRPRQSSTKRHRNQPAKPQASPNVSACKERRKRRRHNKNERITIGSSRPHGIVRAADPDPAPSDQLATIVQQEALSRIRRCW